VIEAGTAALLEPYLDAPGSRGIPNWPREELAEAVAAFDADGFGVHLHAIGDGGVRAALDAIEHAAAVNGPCDRRPVIAHTQLVHPDDLPRFARLGVVANFEPLWARLDPLMMELTIPRLGPERAARQYPIGSLAGRRAGVRRLTAPAASRQSRQDGRRFDRSAPSGGAARRGRGLTPALLGIQSPVARVGGA
jgi:predicted amidohydrolase YtcJ